MCFFKQTNNNHIMINRMPIIYIFFSLKINTSNERLKTKPLKVELNEKQKKLIYLKNVNLIWCKIQQHQHYSKPMKYDCLWKLHIKRVMIVKINNARALTGLHSLGCYEWGGKCNAFKAQIPRTLCHNYDCRIKKKHADWIYVHRLFSISVFCR